MINLRSVSPYVFLSAYHLAPVDPQRSASKSTTACYRSHGPWIFRWFTHENAGFSIANCYRKPGKVIFDHEMHAWWWIYPTKWPCWTEKWWSAHGARSTIFQDKDTGSGSSSCIIFISASWKNNSSIDSSTGWVLLLLPFTKLPKKPKQHSKLLYIY